MVRSIVSFPFFVQAREPTIACVCVRCIPILKRIRSFPRIQIFKRVPRGSRRTARPHSMPNRESSYFSLISVIDLMRRPSDESQMDLASILEEIPL